MRKFVVPRIRCGTFFPLNFFLVRTHISSIKKNKKHVKRAQCCHSPRSPTQVSQSGPAPMAWLGALSRPKHITRNGLANFLCDVVCSTTEGNEVLNNVDGFIHMGAVELERTSWSYHKAHYDTITIVILCYGVHVDTVQSSGGYDTYTLPQKELFQVTW